VLFYVIHKELMTNYEIRAIYAALGGDPRKRGKKKEPNPKALDEFLAGFPSDVKEIRAELRGMPYQPEAPAAPPKTRGVTIRKPAGGKVVVAPPASPPAPPVNKHKAEAEIERFKRRMDANGKGKSARQFAEGARADMENLQKALTSKHGADMDGSDRDAVHSALQAIQNGAKICLNALKR
jgi:hypothetical protein